jgi:hypothetical protein
MTVEEIIEEITKMEFCMSEVFNVVEVQLILSVKKL